MLDVVQHGVDLPCLRRSLVGAVAVAAAVLADQLDDAEPDEHPADSLEDERQREERDCRDGPGDDAANLHPVEHDGIDVQSVEGENVEF